MLIGWASAVALSVANSLFVEAYSAANLPFVFSGGALLKMKGLLYDWRTRRSPFVLLLRGFGFRR